MEIFYLAETFSTFDLIISNPPFRKVNSVRLNPNMVKAISRHELILSLSKLIEKSAPLLNPGAKLVLAYHPDQLEEVLDELPSRQLYFCRLRRVQPIRAQRPKPFLSKP